MGAWVSNRPFVDDSRGELAAAMGTARKRNRFGHPPVEAIPETWAMRIQPT